jgi:hypothetical protein
LNLFESSLPAFALLSSGAAKQKAGLNNFFGCSVFDVGCSPLLPMKTTGPIILIRNLSMRFPRELRIKTNSSPMNKENIEHRTSNIEHSTDYGAFP